VLRSLRSDERRPLHPRGANRAASLPLRDPTPPLTNVPGMPARLLAVLALTVLAIAASAHSAAAAWPSSPTPRQVERFWTPQRMAAARPLEMSVGRRGRADVYLGPLPRPARASYSVVETP